MKRLLTALLLTVSAACATGPPPEWVPAEVPTSSTMRLWEISRLAMERQGFPVVQQGFDPKTHVASSGWRYDLHPFKGQGYRERAEIMYGSGESPGTMTLSVRVTQEINDNVAKPLDLEYAEWAESSDNPEKARVMLQYMRSMLGTRVEVGTTVDAEKEREKKYGEWGEKD
jgi:hypothetical protein